MGQLTLQEAVNVSRVTIEPDSPSTVDVVNFFGEDLEESEFIEQFNKPRTVETVCPPDADLLKKYEEKELEYASSGSSLAKPSVSSTEINKIELYANCLLLAINTVDSYIDENGLRPVVDELKERRWSIMLSLAIYAALT